MNQPYSTGVAPMNIYGSPIQQQPQYQPMPMMQPQVYSNMTPYGGGPYMQQQQQQQPQYGLMPNGKGQSSNYGGRMGGKK